jgi:hypothetical protein
MRLIRTEEIELLFQVVNAGKLPKILMFFRNALAVT